MPTTDRRSFLRIGLALAAISSTTILNLRYILAQDRALLSIDRPPDNGSRVSDNKAGSTDKGELPMIDKKQNLAAPCGLYCGACIIYRANKRGDFEFLKRIREQINKRLSALRKEERLPGMPPPPKIFKPAQMQKDLQREESLYCEGCLSDMLAFPCRNCGFRECALERGLTNCSQCLDSPCQLLIDFNNDGVPHHGEVLDNIERQKEIGMDAWFVEQEKRWCCVQCGSPLGWYDAECPSCGAKQSQTLASPSPV